ncbi:MAG: DUF1569 domain-containing protein [Pirellulaceae bacterium]
MTTVAKTVAKTTATGRGKVDTKKVTGRRTLRFESFDEVLTDAEKMADLDGATIGNWSKGQIYKHLAKSLDMMIDGPPFVVPLPMRLAFRLLMMKRMLTHTLTPGFKLPKRAAHMVPDATSTEEGLAMLRNAVARVNGTSQRGLHPGFGKISQQQWDAFQLRHCEMHLSFIVPS